MTTNGQSEMHNRGGVVKAAVEDLRSTRVRRVKEALEKLVPGDLSPEEAKRWNDDINSKVGGVHDMC